MDPTKNANQVKWPLTTQALLFAAHVTWHDASVPACHLSSPKIT